MIELELSLLSLLTTLANLCYSLDDGAEIFIDTFNQSILEHRLFDNLIISIIG